ncbi:MAG: stage 0 sporulation family protein [Nitrospinota bacterium]
MQTEEQLDNDYTIAVSFRRNAKAYEFRCNHLNLRVGDNCIVDTERGPNMGVVTRARIKAAGRRCHQRLKNVIRKATDKDLIRDERNRKKEQEICRLARKKISENELKMKLSYVEITFDEKRAIIHYTSESRVDFRDMVKSIASELDVKIEMRKLGIRDEAKMFGGCGVCGQELCCSSFLSGFAPVSIRMAKDQNLSLNNSKISGVCGRLMCCLVYENDFYREARKSMGSTGKTVNTPDGLGKIVIADYLRERLTVDLGDGVRKIFNASEVTRFIQPQRQKSGGARNRKRSNGKAAPPDVKPDNGQADKEPQ